MIFLALFAIPLFLALAFFLAGQGKITLGEFAAQLAAQAAIAGVSVAIIYHSNTADTETWNGRVADKARVQVSCEHSYSCNCRTTCSGSGKTRSCSTICQTCHEHFYDFDWRVTTTNKESFEISRIDRQGTREPPRWTQVSVGQPTALGHGYENYIKAAPDTLFRKQGLVEKYKEVLPVYPQKYYDYHKLDRVVAVGLPGQPDWNAQLSELNADLGATKQVNVVVVLLSHMPLDYFDALEQHWLGGKKNDTVVVLSLDQGNVEWARVMAWTDSGLFKVKMRDDLLGLPATPEAILPVVRSTVETYYLRKPMKDFEYLAASITPTVTQWVVSLLMGILVALGLGWLFYKHETF